MERSREAGHTKATYNQQHSKDVCPNGQGALEAIEDAEPEVATTLFKELHATLTAKITIEASPVKRTRTENTVTAQPPAVATTVTATSTTPKPKQMQADSSIRRQPQRSSKKTAAGTQRADENVIAHEQKQADDVEVTNLVSDEEDDVDMKDELVLRHEGMSKRRCEHVRGPHIGEPQRRQLGDDLVEYNKFDVSKQCKAVLTYTIRGLHWISNHQSRYPSSLRSCSGSETCTMNLCN